MFLVTPAGTLLLVFGTSPLLPHQEVTALLRQLAKAFFLFFSNSSHKNRTMKLLMFCGAVALITCASSSVDGDIMLEMREEFAQMKAEMTKIAQLEALCS